MCLMHTDFPVPDGPRIIEIWFSGRPRLRPFRIVLRPNDLWTSMNSTASVEPWSRLVPSASSRGAPPRASARRCFRDVLLLGAALLRRDPGGGGGCSLRHARLLHGRRRLGDPRLLRLRDLGLLRRLRGGRRLLRLRGGRRSLRRLLGRRGLLLLHLLARRGRRR